MGLPSWLLGRTDPTGASPGGGVPHPDQYYMDYYMDFLGCRRLRKTFQLFASSACRRAEIKKLAEPMSGCADSESGHQHAPPVRGGLAIRDRHQHEVGGRGEDAGVLAKRAEQSAGALSRYDCGCALRGHGLGARSLPPSSRAERRGQPGSATLPSAPTRVVSSDRERLSQPKVIPLMIGRVGAEECVRRSGRHGHTSTSLSIR